MAQRTLFMGGFGLALGFSLSFIGFADWTAVHGMFTFADLRMFLAFAGAVALTAGGFAVFGRGRAFGPRPLHRGDDQPARSSSASAGRSAAPARGRAWCSSAKDASWPW